uniref:Uncharacterized protein isoform X1 n=1 Tax=Nicotiana tabacum TaxID=4097 RepID=A0A1S4CEE6_TOBAC|nr:PREDICTED: uncharacterized protein LOC107818086 isoform X1 [Nicotiana tabacum]
MQFQLYEANIVLLSLFLNSGPNSAEALLKKDDNIGTSKKKDDNINVVVCNKNMGSYLAAVTLDVLWIVFPAILCLTEEGVRSLRTNISAYRVSMNLLTCVCILAVDFKIFPRRYAKAETYGTGLMDIGVGSFIVANALVLRQARGIAKIWCYIVWPNSLKSNNNNINRPNVLPQMGSGEDNIYTDQAQYNSLKSIQAITPMISRWQPSWLIVHVNEPCQNSWWKAKEK